MANLNVNMDHPFADTGADEVFWSPFVEPSPGPYQPHSILAPEFQHVAAGYGSSEFLNAPFSAPNEGSSLFPVESAGPSTIWSARNSGVTPPLLEMNQVTAPWIQPALDFGTGPSEPANHFGLESMSPDQLRKEEPTYLCLFRGCFFRGKTAYDLGRHANIHSQSETFPCLYSWCGRDSASPFSRKDYLVDHLRTVHLSHIPTLAESDCKILNCQAQPHPRADHGKTGSFFCLDLCDRANKPFKRWADLVRHHRGAHATEDSDKFPCHVIGCKYRNNGGFARKDKLREHVKRMHTGIELSTPSRRPILPKTAAQLEASHH